MLAQIVLLLNVRRTSMVPCFSVGPLLNIIINERHKMGSEEAKRNLNSRKKSASEVACTANSPGVGGGHFRG